MNDIICRETKLSLSLVPDPIIINDRFQLSIGAAGEPRLWTMKD